ncbi:recombination mediator RecR [Cesiribacter sp. SM1]|uniref:recombination mediator RecR n=1 Tax=Cesiribacter sp. SM1 TaxID=2861196 RepID=UPI001CD7AA03|nr:recombination mediator RecR [Cesiribacter sp. SM1]
MQYPSQHIEKAVEEISKLPGIGRKTALRLALHLLRREETETSALAQALIDLRTKTRNCSNCHNLADSEICSICANPRRDASVICVVENPQDVMAIENTAQYHGLYHVLGGVISPIEGVGPSDLRIDSLVNRVAGGNSAGGGPKEIILAISPTMEGDTTAFYLTRKLKPFGIRISSIARGVPVGGELEYTDEITLGRSILSRTLYNTSGEDKE